MTWRRQSAAGIASAVLVLALAACSRFAPPDTAADLAESREEVRAAATAVFPALAEALGGTIVAARGGYDLSGDGMVNRQRYHAYVVIEDPWTTADEVATAIEALGYDVVQEPEPDNPDWPVVGERGALTLSSSSGPPPLTVGIAGPYLTIPMEEGVPPSADESLDLPGVGDVPFQSDPSRERVREVAALNLPALAESLGGTITAAQGRYVEGGDDDFTYEARVVIEGSHSTDAQIAEALEALGWQDVEANDTGVIAQDGSLTLATTGGSSPLFVMIGLDVPSVTVRATASLDVEGLSLPGSDVPQPEPDGARQSVRDVATRDMPALAESMGGYITIATGQYVMGDDDELTYEARVTIVYGQSTDAQIAEALEALGWQDVEIDDTGVTGRTEHATLTTMKISGTLSPTILMQIRSDGTAMAWYTDTLDSEDLDGL